MPLLSISIPCFNEEGRLPEKLRPYLEWLDKNLLDYEIVLVNDGSTDGTLKMMEGLAAKNAKIKIVNLPENHGRGFGMKTGVLASSGQFVLETDADLPVSPDHIPVFLNFLKDHPEISFVIGSREHQKSGFVLKQTWARVFAGKVFHRLFMWLFGSQFKDVMCGFKLFRHDVANDIFKYVYDEKFLAAGEIIYVANKFGYKVAELPVVWEDDRRSKVKIVRDTFRTLKGMFELWLRNLQGRYIRKND